MADRFLRASGNWSGPVWSATSDGAAGSASTPTVADIVYISENHTVTLSANAECMELYHTNGTLSLGSYTLTIAGGADVGGGLTAGARFYSTGNTTRTINLDSGRLVLEEGASSEYDPTQLYFSGSNLTLNSGISLVELNVAGSPTFGGLFSTASKVFNDVHINLGDDNNWQSELYITGSPTFRSLIIQSKNSEAHTVNFTGDGAEIKLDKFVAIGSSSSDKLTIQQPDTLLAQPIFTVPNTGTFYGQNLHIAWMWIEDESFEAPSWAYIGAGSTQSGTNNNFVTQDPPKISTLVDPLTTAPGSNPNWTVSGTVTQVTTGKDGGGYQLANGAEIISTDTYDLLSSTLNFQTLASTSLKFNTWGYSHSLDANKFYRLSLTGATYLLQNSDDGASWTNVTSSTVDPNNYRSMRIEFEGAGVLGTVNTSFNQSPTTTLNSPANNVSLTTTTPTLAFTATDPEGEDVSYQVQVSTSSSFTSTHMDVTTATFPSGTQQTRVVSPALTKGGITYYWRVRAKDPSGSNSYGEWSATRTMITEAIAPTVTSGSATSITTNSASVAGNVTATGGANVTERGIAYGLSANPTTSTNKQTSGSGSGAFTANLTGLSSNTEYHYRAYAINSKGTSYGASQTFTTLPIPPTVQTGTAGSITLSSATISANAISANPDSQTITERGVVYSTAQNPTTASNKQTGSGSPFNVSLTDLSENTTYYVRAYAIWSGGTVYGSQISFRTTGRPSVTLNTPSAGGTVADVRPDLKFTGVDPDSDNITYQLQISSASNFASTVVDVLSGSSAGFTGASGSDVDPFFSGSQITYKLQQDLTRGLTYYWRVRGKDPAGSDTWGEWTAGRMFTVDAVIPTLTLSAVHTVLDVSAKADAVVSSDGGASVTERGIVWSTSQNPTTADDKATASGTTGAFTADLTDLTGATTYYVRAYAINAKGTAYSNQISFQTLAPIEPPSVTTGNASFITDLTARIAGEVTSDGTRPILERGICFSEDNDPPTVDDRTFADIVNAVGAFEVRLTGLDPETTYYYRAYAVNDQGVGYGETKTFTTAEPYLPDEGDGYWTWSPGRSQATISRSQPTPAYAAVNLSLAELGLEDGKTYTFSVGDIEADNGAPSIVLERVEDGDTLSDTINPNSSYTFTYDEDILHWTLRFFITDDEAVADDITASFYELYLAEEPTFSEFVPFTPKGVTEIRIANNELVDKRRGEVIQTIYDALHGESYYPFNIDTEGLGWLEIGDGFTITDPDENSYPVVVWNSKITIDGGIKENLFTETPDKTHTDYKRAGDVTKRIKNAQIIVDKQEQTIEAITSDMYEEGGYINEQFSQVYQDIESVTTTVQGAGGINLIRNSVMYAYDDDGVPENWDVTGAGTLKIEASPESRAAGGVSAHAFTLIDKTVTQRVTVKKDVDFISESDRTYYTLSLKVKKNTVGAAYIKLSNRNEEHQIDFPDQTEYYWAEFDLPELLPQDSYFDIEIYSEASAELQVTDLMLSIGKARHEWTQANGEIMNTSVAITEDGMTIRSAEFRNDYTKINALGLEVHSKEVGGDRVFGFNKDETNVSKLKADHQITMLPLRMVPIEYDSYSGWAIAPAKEND